MRNFRRSFGSSTLLRLIALAAGIALTVGLAAITAPAAAGAAPATACALAGKGCVTGIALSSPNIDVTYADGAATVSLHVVDPLTATDTTGVQYAQVTATYTQSANAYPNSSSAYLLLPPSVGEVVGTQGVLASGTAQDGVWKSNLTLPAGNYGTFALTVILEIQGTYFEITPATLAAAGVTSTVATHTTAAPLTPSAITGKTVVLFQNYSLVLDGQITWKAAANSPADSNIIVDSASSACGYVIVAYGAQLTFQNRTFGSCSVRFRLVNGSGSAKQVSVSFF